jgi:hypothetical protein
VVSIVRGDESVEQMLVQHDSDPAPAGDVDFVAHCREDTRYLLTVAMGMQAVDRVRVTEIADRLRQTTPGVWTAFLETQGGLAGPSIIQFSVPDFGPDLYLEAYGEAAPDADYAFVAAAHEHLPRLVAQLLPSS